jgi:molecular chaperone HscB
MDPAFLMEQMELREKLAGIRDEADPFGELEQLRAGLEESLRSERKALGAAFEAGDSAALARAADGVRRLQFLNKLASEVDEMEEALDDAL